MKKVLVILGFVALCLVTNVIYARQVNGSQPACYVENCPQTSRNRQQDCQTECYVEDCPRIQKDVHHNQVEYHDNDCRMRENNHHTKARHHQ